MKMSELLDSISTYYSTPEIKIPSPDDKKNLVVEKIKAIQKDARENNKSP